MSFFPNNISSGPRPPRAPGRKQRRRPASGLPHGPAPGPPRRRVRLQGLCRARLRRRGAEVRALRAPLLGHRGRAGAEGALGGHAAARADDRVGRGRRQADRPPRGARGRRRRRQEGGQRRRRLHSPSGFRRGVCPRRRAPWKPAGHERGPLLDRFRDRLRGPGEGEEPAGRARGAPGREEVRSGKKKNRVFFFSPPLSGSPPALWPDHCQSHRLAAGGRG